MSTSTKNVFCRPPVPTNDQARLAELYRFEILDTLPEEAFDRLTALTAAVFDVPIALITFVDKDRHWFKSQVGFPVAELPRENGFCGYTIMNDDLMVVPDATLDVRFAKDPAVVGPAAIRFYAGAPLILESGFRLGTICMMDSKPRQGGLSDREQEILISMAELAVREIEYRQETANRTLDLSDELTNAQSAKQQFLQMLSHELRTPLNAVIGFGTLVATAPSDAVHPKYAGYGDDICNAGNHLLDLIDGMLDWTRLERGELQIDDQVLPVADLVDTALSLLPGAVDRVDVMPSAKLPPLRCDPRYIVQVLAHVMENAITFSPKDKRVSVTADVNDTGNFLIRISDLGPGVNSEARTRAFEVFEKFDPAGMKFAEGIGLGLAISRKLMEVHGGGIEFADDPEAGTTVLLSFPAHRTVL